VTELTYLRYEVLRTWRNRRFLLFSLAFPLVLFLAVAGPHKNVTIQGISFPLYYMTGMIAWGSMVAVISSGARIAAERAVGWTRQLRITPLPTWSYFAAKIFCGYMMALFSMVVLFVAGSFIGVRLDTVQWLTMIGLLLVGLIPFSVMGIMFGHLLKLDSLGPAIGGVTSLFALLGGAYSPLVTSGFSVHARESASLPIGSFKPARRPAPWRLAPRSAGSSSRRMDARALRARRSRLPTRHQADLSRRDLDQGVST
jgi:ABC-2 type transport system permease protein